MQRLRHLVGAVLVEVESVEVVHPPRRQLPRLLWLRQQLPILGIIMDSMVQRVITIIIIRCLDRIVVLIMFRDKYVFANLVNLIHLYTYILYMFVIFVGIMVCLWDYI